MQNANEIKMMNTCSSSDLGEKSRLLLLRRRSCVYFKVLSQAVKHLMSHIIKQNINKALPYSSVTAIISWLLVIKHRYHKTRQHFYHKSLIVKKVLRRVLKDSKDVSSLCKHFRIKSNLLM